MGWNKCGKYDDFFVVDKWFIYDFFDVIIELL